MTQQSTTSLATILDRGLNDALRRTGVPVGFAGLVRPDQRHFVISTLRGTWTNSLANLAVRAGEGLGGKALALGRPAVVDDYHSAQGITRRYDRLVSPEHLTSIISIPVALPGQAPTAVLYLAERNRGEFGGVLQEKLRPVVARLAQDLHIEAEVARRARLDPAASAPQAVDPSLLAELADVASSTTDPDARERLTRLLGSLGPAGSPGFPGSPGSAGADSPADRPDSPLTPREAEVVRGAADGLSNADVAARLGLTEGTVKSYMKSAMAKLGAANRVQAGLIARRHGYLP